MKVKLNPSRGRMFKSVDYTGTFYQGCGTERDPYPCDYCLTKFLPWGSISHKPSLRQHDMNELLEVRDCTVFLNSVHDSYAPVIPSVWISGMHRWIGRQHPSIRFYLQSKYIDRAHEYHLDELEAIKKHVILGTTIPSNREEQASRFSRTSPIGVRVATMQEFSKLGFRTRLSHEPLQAFDVKELLRIDTSICPELVEIGLDNYQHRHRLDIPQPGILEYEEYRNGLMNRNILFEEKDSIKRWRERELKDV